MRYVKSIFGILFAFTVLALIRVGLSTVGYKRLRHFVRQGAELAPLSILHRYSLPVRRAARLVPRASCLTQALAVQFLLARRGFGSTIKVGVREEGGRILAHAWLISGDRVVIGGAGAELAAYTPLTELTPPGRQVG